MFRIEQKRLLPAGMLAVLLLTAFLPGGGLRQSQTGSLSSRIIDADGNAVVNAEVFSIFAETEKVRTALDGSFYLSEIPAGLNNIVIIHPDFALEERQVDIKSSGATVVDFIRLDKANAPHRISDIRVVSVATTSAVITWNTYRSVICSIDYGTTTSYGGIYREQRPTEMHEAVLSDLKPETLYHFRVQYIDDNAATYYSYDFSFRTESGDRPAAPRQVQLAPLVALHKVTVQWEAALGQSADGYNVYRQSDGGDWAKLNETPLSKNTLEYTDQTVEAGMFCRYAVAAVNAFMAESEKSTTASIFVPGIITRNVSIKTAQSPVKLYADLIIAAGAHFVVEAGCEFLIADNDAFASGADEQRIEIVAHGRLALEGTREKPVKFGSLGGSGKRDHWSGIRILSSLTGISQIQHVQIFGCSGYAVDVTTDRVKIDNLAVSYSESGLSLDGLRDFIELESCSFNEIRSIGLRVSRCRRVLLNNSAFIEVGEGIVNFTDYADDQLLVKNSELDCINTGVRGVFGKLRFLNSLFVVSEGTAMIFENALNTRENYVDHCTIEARNGIVIRSGEFVIENNIINNRGLAGEVGINNTSILTPDYAFNNVYGFGSAYSGCAGGLGAIQTDPKFVGGNPYSYALQADSSLRLQDRYGSEMGRYGSSRL